MMDKQEKLFNSEYELVVLSSLLFQENYEKINHNLNPFFFLDMNDFYSNVNKSIFSIMQKLYENNQSINEIILKHELVKKDIFDEVVLINIMSTSPVSNLTEYIKELRDKRMLRDLNQTSIEIKKDIESKKAPSEIISQTEIFLDQISSKDGINIISTGRDLIKKYELSEGIKRVETGFPFIDNALGGGFDEGSLVIFSGEEEIGKSHLAYSIAERASLEHVTGVISIEFGENDYAARLIQMKKNNIEFNEKNILTNFDSIEISELSSTLYKFAHKGARIVVIDSLHEAEYSRATSTTEAVNYIAKKIKNIAKKTGMVIILIVLGSKEDYKNKKASVRDSSMIPHMAKVFIRISDRAKKNRKILYWHKNKQVKENSKKIQEVIYEKNGRISYVSNNENKKVMDISEL